MVVIASDQRERGNPWFRWVNAGLLRHDVPRNDDSMLNLYDAPYNYPENPAK